MEPVTILILCAIGFAVSFFAITVGGGGLVMTPLLIAVGVPPHAAVAAVRLSTLGAAPTGLYNFHRWGKVAWKMGVPLVLVSVAASFMAANIALALDALALQRLIGIVILGILAVSLLKSRIGLEDRSASVGKRSRTLGYALVFLGVLLGHVISGGTGVLISYVLIFFFGMTYLQSSGTRKIANFAGSIMSSSVFILAGAVPYEIAVPLTIAAMLGAWAGSRYALRRGEDWVRWLFLAVVSALAIRMLLFS